MKFKDYLRTLQNDDTPHGDVARDVLADKRAPTTDNYEGLRTHVANSGAPQQVVYLLDDIHSDYEQAE